MNLAELLLPDSRINPEAPHCPIILKIWPKTPKGLETLNAARRRPFEEDVLKVLEIIQKHPGSDYPFIVKSSSLHRNRVNAIVHRLIRNDKVIGKGNQGRKRYFSV